MVSLPSEWDLEIKRIPNARGVFPIRAAARIGSARLSAAKDGVWADTNPRQTFEHVTSVQQPIPIIALVRFVTEVRNQSPHIRYAHPESGACL